MAIFNSKLLVYQRVITITVPGKKKKPRPSWIDILQPTCSVAVVPGTEAVSNNQ